MLSAILKNQPAVMYSVSNRPNRRCIRTDGDRCTEAYHSFGRILKGSLSSTATDLLYADIGIWWIDSGASEDGAS
jgi:hypothetical protein